MKNVIKPDPISLTTHHLHMGFSVSGLLLASGTGFVYRDASNYFLTTNWHNVTGRNPLNGEYFSVNAAAPDIISTLFRDKENPGNCHREIINLYQDEHMLEPVWLEHPKYGRKVDAVAIPLNEKITENYKLFAINDISFDDEFKEEVADEAFVVGYPFSDVTYMQMPIWKKASIASEPDINLNDVPKMLIDTATRPGLSGSPVIMQRIGIHGMKNGIMTGSEIIGRIRKFLGIYSGRIGEDEFKAQLGIVWKARVVTEIIQGSQRGGS